MTTKLVWMTQDSEKLIAYIARVSNPDNQENPSYKGLIKYLIKNQHWSPFEMVNLCIEINTTRAISAQILRHRSFSFQEFSQRYADVTTLCGCNSDETIELRTQDLKNRQNSVDNLEENKKEKYTQKIKEHNERTLTLYKEMLEDGIAKECARSILPLSTSTRIYMNGTLRSWIHYLKLRSKNGTQKEHSDIAISIIENIIKKELPVIYEVLFVDEDRITE